MFEKYDEIEQKVIRHGEKIKCLEEFKEGHEEEHRDFNKEFVYQHKLNTKTIEYIVKGLFYVLGICSTVLLIAALRLIMK